ncbi:oligosaccharide repeat unit polymerase [Klenkia terrae]|uniref:Oligosaccharide repeat unit polymerase n=1 Tax=Klenkia terrae TaxID=1052259 RepID=A0ABU8E3S6_9ACTN|nr:oligosaccharide repeat unit polymerase [Klenkia terrae]
MTAPVKRTAPWWISPAGALTLLVPVTLLLTWRMDDSAFRLFYRSSKSVTGSTLLLVGVAALVLAGVATATAVLAPSGRRRLIPVPGVVPERLAASAQGLFWVTIGGYVLYTGAGIANGLDPAAVVTALITQENYGGNSKEALQGIAGVTTLTQVGIAFTVVATYVLVTRWERRLAIQLGIVLLLSLVRSFVASERLALVEVAVPAVVIAVLAAGRSHVRAKRRVASWAPVVLAPLVFLLFAAFEYSRSWQFFKTRTDESFPVFALIRMAGYYATSYNNGELHLDNDGYPGRLPLDSIAAFWTAPGIGQLDLYDKLSAPAPAISQDVLERFGNPEFNNPGGFTTPFVDFGLVGGFVFFVVVALVIGALFRGFLEGSPVGALLYPMVVTGLFDLPRYLYWTQGRVVPAVLALLVVALYVGRPDTRRRAPHLRSSRPRPPLPAHRHPAGAGR